MPRIFPSWLLALVLSALIGAPAHAVYSPDYKSGDFADPYGDGEN
jgi:hypothetical protein